MAHVAGPGDLSVARYPGILASSSMLRAFSSSSSTARSRYGHPGTPGTRSGYFFIRVHLSGHVTSPLTGTGSRTPQTWA
eukprot:2088336-Rhodomonas_salina.1